MFDRFALSKKLQGNFARKNSKFNWAEWSWARGHDRPMAGA
jgi:hypothetical protein